MYPASVECQNRYRIIPKLRLWALRATVVLGFAVCDWLVSHFYVYLSIVFSACHYCWICLLVWLLSFFYYIFISIFFFILISLFNFIYFSFFLFFLPFLLSQVAEKVLVLRPGVRPEPLKLERLVQDIGPPQTSQHHVISIGGSSPRFLHLNAKTQIHSMTSTLQCWTPHAKLARL